MSVRFNSPSQHLMHKSNVFGLFNDDTLKTPEVKQDLNEPHDLAQILQRARLFEGEEEGKGGSEAAASITSLKPIPSPSHRMGVTNWRQDPFMGNFKLGEELGSGQYSTAYRVYNETERVFYVLKVTRLKDERMLKYMESETSNLQALSHEGVISYKTHAIGSGHFFTVLELMPSSEELLNLAGILDYKTFRYVAAQIVSILEYLKEKEVLHRDLKLENFLINDQAQIKLIDFGFSKRLGPNEKARTWLGTPGYMSPERLAQREYDFSSEIWSFAVILNGLGFGCLPFEGSDLETTKVLCNDIKARTFKRIPDPRMVKNTFYRTELIDLICGCLQWTPKRRLNIEDLKRQNFFKAHSVDQEQYSDVVWDQLDNYDLFLPLSIAASDQT